MQSSVPLASESSAATEFGGFAIAPVTGSTGLPVGSTAYPVTGLNLPATPSAVIFWLVPQNGDAAIGATPGPNLPTTDGFTVTFAEALPTANYLLVWLITFN